MNVKVINGTSLAAATYEVDGRLVTLTLHESTCTCGCVTSVSHEGREHIKAVLEFRRPKMLPRGMAARLVGYDTRRRSKRWR